MKLVELVLIIAVAIPVFAQLPIDEKLPKARILTSQDAKLFVELNQRSIGKVIVDTHGASIGRIRDFRFPGELGGGTGAGGSGVSYGIAFYPFEFSTQNRQICTARVSVIYGHSQNQNGIERVSVDCRSDHGLDTHFTLTEEQLGSLAPAKDILLPASQK